MERYRHIQERSSSPNVVFFPIGKGEVSEIRETFSPKSPSRLSSEQSSSRSKWC